jgi:RimJ/RimL family protein N-acetyltransferase
VSERPACTREILTAAGNRDNDWSGVMLRGRLVGLRAPVDSDVPILHAQLYDDVVLRSESDPRPWRPIAASSAASPYAVTELGDDTASFSVVTLAEDELAGAALLWGIDTHNRSAHLGISLLPSCRRRGIGTDVVRVLCRYGFAIRGLHRLQIETLSDNAAMIGAAGRVGFVLEGTLRANAWVNGRFIDEVVMGLLAEDWADERVEP